MYYLFYLYIKKELYTNLLMFLGEITKLEFLKIRYEYRRHLEYKYWIKNFQI